MEKIKRCSTCGSFPFCNYYKREENGKECTEWKDREVQTHLKSKKGEVFEFKEVK